jgi:hypothetical protein
MLNGQQPQPGAHSRDCALELSQKIKSSTGVKSGKYRMTKKLEQLFDLPPVPDEDPIEIIEEHKTAIRDIDLAIDKIDAALPTVRDLETADQEMDDLASLARDKFDDLMDLGMNLEPRYAGLIFQTAGVLLGHAITAKQAKLDKKLRMVSLQLQKARLDQAAAKGEAAAPAVEGQGIVLDRNALLAEILGKGADNQKDKKA